mgnify:CR=1 FL=1
MSATVEERGDVLLLRVDLQRLVAETSAPVRRVFTEVMASPRRLVALDLGQVAFADSSGLSVLLLLRKAIPPGGRLAVFGVGPSLRALFRLTRVDRVLTLVDNEADALRDLQTPA